MTLDYKRKLWSTDSVKEENLLIEFSNASSQNLQLPFSDGI